MECYAETVLSNALIGGVRLTEFYLITLYVCVRQKIFHP
jgi:hypothetical protein